MCALQCSPDLIPNPVAGHPLLHLQAYCSESGSEASVILEKTSS